MCLGQWQGGEEVPHSPQITSQDLSPALPEACPQEPQELQEEEEDGGLREKSWFFQGTPATCSVSLKFPTRVLLWLCPPQA